MKKFILSALICCMAATAFAQTTGSRAVLKGLVTDSASHQPLGYITISVKDSLTQQPVKSGLTKDNGSFELSGLPAKACQLAIAAVGYQRKVINLPASLWLKNELADIGTITLAAATNELKAVSVTGTKPVVKQEIDRLSYDVQADPDSKSLTAMEMLRKVPMITVDGDDNVQLQGSGSYRIFINGKPSALMTNNPKDVLRSMPANTIQKIEVITTPPAKYDAEGLAGIINIITTKKAADGYSGSVMGRYNNPWGPGGNVTATYKKDKLGISASVGDSRQTHTVTGFSSYRETYSPAITQYSQEGNRGNKGNYFYGSADLSYEIDTLHLLTGSFNYNNGQYHSSADYLTQYTSELATVLPQSYNLLNAGSSGYNGTDATLNYQWGFKRNKNQLLTASYRYSGFQSSQTNNLAAVNRVNYNVPDYNQQNESGTREHTIQLDYVHPVKQLTIEAGTKGIFRHNFSNSAAQNLISDNGQTAYIDDPVRTNNFTYNQNVYSLYNSYTYQFTNWTVKAGARLEHTHVDANFITNSSALDMDYTNVIPSISIQRRFKNNQSLTFGFTNRLERPGIWQLNPFVDKSNPQIISTGNPGLRPVLSHLLEINYSKSGISTFNIKASYFYTGNGIQGVTRLLSDSVSLNTYANIGTIRQTRLDFNDNFPVGKKVSVTLNTNIFYIWLRGYDNGRYYENEGPRTNTFASVGYKPGNDWQFTLSGGYNRRYITLQGSSKDYTYSYLSVAKTVFDKKLTITGTVNNPYQKRYAFTTYSQTPDLYQSNTSNNYYRTFNVSLIYKFGKLNSDIKKNKRSINNDDKSGNSN